VLDTLSEAGRRSGLPCDTDLEAHIAVLKHLGATRIALATRWHETTTTLLTRYLAEAGIEVIANHSRPSTFAQQKSAEPDADHRLALELGGKALRETPQAQAVLMPGGLWHAMHAVPVLEAEYGKPVLLNILSTTWAALRAAGKRMQVRPDARWGKVLASV
jgi:maleate cis-trans isomerase